MQLKEFIDRLHKANLSTVGDVASVHILESAISIVLSFYSLKQQNVILKITKMKSYRYYIALFVCIPHCFV